MSIFKKSVTSFVLATMLWQSAGMAIASTIKYSGQEPIAAIQDNPLARMLNPMGNMAEMGMGGKLNDGLDSDGGINIPLSSNGKIQDPALLRKMLTELSNMAASAPVEIALEGHRLETPSLQKDMTNGDARVRSNDTGAVISNLGADTQSKKVFDMSESAPMLWARYYPNRRVGYIQMITMRKKAYTSSFDVAARLNNPDTRAGAIADSMEIQTEVLGPIDGERLVKGNGMRLAYRGVNPFAAFMPAGADPKMYSNISFPAFLTAVGVWGRNYSTQRGFVAVAETRQEKQEWNRCTMKIFGACLKRESHIESFVELRPRWYLMTAAENAIGKSNSTAYSATGAPGATPCKDRQSLLPVGAAFDSARATECVVFSGAGFLEATSNADIPNGWLKVWHQHQANEGFTMLFYFLVILVVAFAFSALIGPIFAGGMGATLAGGSALNVVMTIAFVDGVLVAGAYGLATILLNGSGNITDVQNGFLGDLKSGVDIPNLAAEGNPSWSPHECIVNGTRTTSAYLFNGSGASAPRFKSPLPPSGCINWLKNDLNTTPGAVGEFYNSRKPNALRDYTTPNDLQYMRTPETRPRRFDGAPVRE